MKNKSKVCKKTKASSEQKIKDLERYIEKTVKDQMKAYEDQIKDLKEVQQKERKKFNKEKSRFSKDLDNLHLKVKELEDPEAYPNRESYEEDYENNLKKVVLQLDKKFNECFQFKANNNLLVISPAPHPLAWQMYYLKDQQVEKLSQDLIPILGENNLLNLIGLKFSFEFCEDLTDETLQEVAIVISNPSLRLQHLIFDLRNNPNFTDDGVETVAKAILKSCRHLQELKFDFSADPSEVKCQISYQKEQSLKKRFTHVPKFEI